MNKNRIRIGKDFTILWSLVNKQGEPLVLNADVLTLYLVSAYGRMKVEGYKVSGNIIEWVFRGKDQKAVGDYTLELVSREGEIGMLTTDRVNAFTLVSHTYQESLNPTEAVEVQTVEISSEVVLSPVIDLSGYLLIEDVATINGQPLTNGGNIEIKEYDDTEIRNKLAELSAEKEDKANKVTSLTDESTDEQYPSAKAVYALKERISENEVLIEDLQNTKIDREADDYYPKLAVGLADNLSGVDVVDSEFNFRRSGGGAISDGVARIEAIKGNSVVWNQKIDFEHPVAKGTSSITFENGEWVLSLSGGSSNAIYFPAAPFVKGRAMLVLCEYNSEESVNNINLKFGVRQGAGSKGQTFQANKFNSIWPISADIETGDGALWIWTNSASIIRIKSLRVIDITLSFPINPPTTIEEFYARIPMGVDLNAYNEGEVIHCNTEGIKSVGDNAWDEEWEVGKIDTTNGELVSSSSFIRSKNAIRVIPSSTYYYDIPNTANGTYMGFATFYDNTNTFVSYAPIAGTAYKNVTTPSNAEYMRFYLRNEYGTTYNHDIMITLVHSGWKQDTDAGYQPYWQDILPLPIISKYFPDGMKSAGSAHDEIRYNKATQKWEKVQRIGEVDMGSLQWSYFATYGFYATAPNNMVEGNLNYLTNLSYSKYANPDRISWSNGDKAITNGLSTIGTSWVRNICVKDSAYTDTASFKAAMQGVMLYYELAEPIVTELDEADQFKDLDYQVWNCGTEKAIAEGKSAPLAADITYGFNAIGKIKELESLVAALRAKVGI